MQNQQTQTLEQLLAERVSAYAAGDRPRELIDAGIEKLFKDVVDDAFRSYGDFGRAIKDAVKEALPANVSDMFELTRYNALVAEALRQRWEAAAVSETLMTKATASIEEVLKNDAVSGEVSLRALLEAFIEAHKEEAAENGWEAPEIRFEEKEAYGSTTLAIYFDPQPESDWKSGNPYSSRNSRNDYSLKHRLHIRLSDEVRPAKERWNRDVQVGEVYHAQLDDKKVSLSLNIREKWERMLASLYFGNAKVLVDCDADEFSYGIYG